MPAGFLRGSYSVQAEIETIILKRKYYFYLDIHSLYKDYFQFWISDLMYSGRRIYPYKLRRHS